MTKTRPSLSNRLRCIADCVRAVAARYALPPRMADIGCDHGLVPADLIITGDIDHAVASDIREGPLQAARGNAERFGVSERMLFVCADGLGGIGQNAAEICVITGMGGELIREILATADLRSAGIQYLVLSPHTKAAELRRYLRDAGFTLLSEIMAEEDDKTYPILTLSVLRTENREDAAKEKKNDCYQICIDAIAKAAGYDRPDALRVAYAYGPVLLARRDAALKRFLLKQRERLANLLDEMKDHDADVRSLERSLRDACAALAVYREDASERRHHAVQ